MSQNSEVPNLLGRISELESQVRAWEEKFENLTRDTAFLKAVIDKTPLPIYLKDADGKYITVNRNFEKLSGFTLEQFKGKTDFDIFPAPVAQLFRDQDQAVKAARGNKEFEETIPLPDGVHTFITLKFPLFDENGGICGVGGVCTDITSRKEMELRLSNDQKRLSVTMDSLAEGVIATDRTGVIFLMNRVATNLTGWSKEEALGKALAQVLCLFQERGDSLLHISLKTLFDTTPLSSRDKSYILKSRDGSNHPIQLHVTPLSHDENQVIDRVIVFGDITERRRMEQELLKTEKMESLKVIAGGIAHDFNNFLASILGNLSLVSAMLGDSDTRIQRILGEAERASLQARNLTQQLLTFTKGGEPIKSITSLPEIIRDSANFILRGSRTRCEFCFPTDLWAVEIDPGQMSQVIQNVMINASQAMSGGGMVQVRCENVTPGPGSPPSLSPGRYVRLTIEDTGGGIPEEFRGKIFDPFFTTKPGGTGLGLAITYSIITRHGGSIEVCSNPGQGSVFSLFLPASDRPPSRGGDARIADRQETRPVFSGQKPQGKILILDDEEALREMLREILDFLGYEAVSSSRGEEAVHLYETYHQRGNPFDVVIMDLTIPGGMGGQEAMKLLRGFDPEAKVIVSSGFSNAPVMSNYAEYGFSGVLTKPYRVKDLQEVLRKLLPS